MFVRGLFGDAEVKRHGAVLADVARAAKEKHQSIPCAFYAFGEENAAAIQQHVLADVVVIGPPVEDFDVEGADRRFNYRDRPMRDLTDGEIRVAKGERDGLINWGMSIWRHKLEIMARALADHGEIVWLDWDVVQTRELPGDFWATLRDGPPFRATLVQYQRHVCRWRSKKDGGYQPLAAWVYCRNEAIVDEALRYLDDEPLRSEQVALAWAIDQRLITSGRVSDAWLDLDIAAEPWFNCDESVHGIENPLFAFGWRKKRKDVPCDTS